MKKKIAIIVPVLLLVAAATFVGIRMATAPSDIAFVQTAIVPELPNLDEIIPADLSEKVAVAVDGQVAFKNSDEMQPTASTAKMIMALMVLEKQPLELGDAGPTINITAEFYNRYLYYATHNGSHTKVALGEQISEYDGLASAMLVSSNNMSDTLAIWAFGSLDAYKEYAQARLKEWGLNNTTIGIDASGFSRTTTSTAADLAIIAQKLMANPVLAEIVGKKTHNVPVAGELTNTNKLLGEVGIVGVKTGWIGDYSGYCLASAYKIDEHVVTVVVLNAPTREESFSVSRQIVEKLQESLHESEIIAQNQEVGYYESWWGGKTPIRAAGNISALTWSGTSSTLALNMDELRDGQEATGKLFYSFADKNASTRVSTEGLKTSPSFWDRLQYALFLK